jgi:thioredoxin 1
MDKIIELQNAEQLESFRESDNICVVDCYADWCGPCKRVMPVFKKIAEDFENEAIEFYKLKIDLRDSDIQEFVEEVGIEFIPLFLICRKGKILEKVEDINNLSDRISSEMKS